MPMTPPNFRRIGVVLGLAAALTFAGASTQSGLSLSVAPAAAAKKHNITRPYLRNWVFRSTKLKRCVFVEVRGSMVGTWEYLYGDGSNNTDHDSLYWTKMRLKNPTISATGWPIRGAGCDSTKRWKMKADLSQGWHQSGCRLKVSVSNLSVGIPWSVSASPSYSCGKNKVGHRDSTEGPSKKTLNQFNSGFPLKFANTPASRRAGGVAFTGVITVRAHTKSSSDAVRYAVTVALNK
jgi:hypothetical protein